MGGDGGPGGVHVGDACAPFGLSQSWRFGHFPSRASDFHRHCVAVGGRPLVITDEQEGCFAQKLLETLDLGSFARRCPNEAEWGNLLSEALTDECHARALPPPSSTILLQLMQAEGFHEYAGMYERDFLVSDAHGSHLLKGRVRLNMLGLFRRCRCQDAP
eukprot:5110435-Amphidinium_carterae.2